METRFWDRRILGLALPALASSAVPLVHRWVDMVWCKELGTEATAALSLATISVWIYTALGMLVAIGLTALVARYVGANRAEGARYVAGQGLRWSVVVGLVGAVVGWFGAPWLFASADATAGVAEHGIAYIRIYWAGGAFVMLQFAGDAIFRGQGNTRTPMRIAVTSLALNVVLDPLFIFGVGPIPGGGVAGAALATIVATALAAGLHFRALRIRRHVASLRPDDAGLRLTPNTRLGRPGRLGLDGAVFVRIARIGLPAALASVGFNVITLLLMRCAQESGGAAAQAGMGVGYSGEGVAYVTGLGWSAAAAALVGQQLGAGRPNDAAHYAWRAVQQCALVSGLWGGILFLFNHELAAIFAEREDAIRHGAAYYAIISWCLAPQAMELVLDGAFGGAGLTLPPMVISLGVSATRVPLAYFAAFTLDMGPAGIFWVIAITAAIRGLLVGWWFHRGTWRTREV